MGDELEKKKKKKKKGGGGGGVEAGALPETY